MPSIQYGLFITSLIFLQLISGSTQDSCSGSERALTRLKRELFCGYDKILRPVASETTTTHALLHLFVRYIDLDEANHALTVSSWTSLKWKDEFLTWDPRVYEGINSITLNSEDIWVPDISLLTANGATEVPHGLPASECRVEPGGDVHCSPLFTHVAHCAAKLTQWPFDRQTCEVTFGSWAHVNEFLNTTLEGKGVSSDRLKPNAAWELLGISTKIVVLASWDNNTFSRIEFYFELRRHSGAHLATVVVPALVLSVMTLLTLLLEATCPERITLGCMNVLAHCLYMQYLGMKLPPNGDTVPTIVVFFRDSMFMVGASLVLAVLVRGVSRARTQAPAWLASVIGAILSTRPGQILLLSQLSSISGAAALTSGDDRDTLVGAEDGGGGGDGALSNSGGGDGGIGNSGGGDRGLGNSGDRGAVTVPADTTWQHTACLLDRVGLVVFCITFFVLLVGYIP